MTNLTVKQAAEALEVSESTIRKMIKDGCIKTTRLRERSPYRISVEEVNKYKGVLRWKD